MYLLNVDLYFAAKVHMDSKPPSQPVEQASLDRFKKVYPKSIGILRGGSTNILRYFGNSPPLWCG